VQQHLLREVRGDAFDAERTGSPVGLADDDEVAAAAVPDDRIERRVVDDARLVRRDAGGDARRRSRAGAYR